MNPAMIFKATELRDRLKKKPLKAIRTFEDVKPLEDGSAVYIFEAQFATIKEANTFKALAEISKELESWFD